MERYNIKLVKSKAVCPKCKSNNLMLEEIWKDSSITWEQINGIFDRNDGSLEHGYAYKVEAKCKACAHIWTFKKASQIDDIVIEQIKP